MVRVLVLMCVVLIGNVRSVSASEAGSDTTVARSPRGAMLRSLAVPGWGQFYNQKTIKAGVIAAAEVGSVVAFFVRRDEIRRNRIPGQTSDRNLFLFSTLGVILYSMADAYVDAHLDGVDWGVIEADLGKQDPVVRVVVRFRF